MIINLIKIIELFLILLFCLRLNLYLICQDEKTNNIKCSSVHIYNNSGVTYLSCSNSEDKCKLSDIINVLIYISVYIFLKFLVIISLTFYYYFYKVIEFAKRFVPRAENEINIH
jgi:hypothetical protein